MPKLALMDRSDKTTAPRGSKDEEGIEQGLNQCPREHQKPRKAIQQTS
jgi:hypothetical protein